jgi:hypothetical protein
MVYLFSEDQQAQDPGQANISVQVQRQERSISELKTVQQEEFTLLSEGSAFCSLQAVN